MKKQQKKLFYMEFEIYKNTQVLNELVHKPKIQEKNNLTN
jgi:hypothetical protein